MLKNKQQDILEKFMFDVRESVSGDIYLKPENISFLDKENAQLLRQKVNGMAKENMVLVINLENIKNLNSDGFNELHDLMFDSNEDRYVVKFINCAENYAELIDSLTNTSEA